jgi:hypothetical protein
MRSHTLETKLNIQDPREDLIGLQEEQLFALARNDAAQWLYRKVAASLLKEKGLLKANHPEIAHVLAASLADVVAVSHESEVSAIAESTPKAESVAPISADIVTKPPVSEGFDEKNSGPFKASVTTATMSVDTVVQ